MVMHARKTQRMNDGYFEKHQTHPYQNSKYSSSKGYGSSSDRYERIRDSPNGNYRSDSPDSQSPRERDRSYQSKGSYLQKIREKERENRDYKMSRDKYSDCVRSPKDKRSRDSEHRTNIDRNEEKSILHPIKMSQNMSSRDRKPVHNNSIDKRDERDRVARVGDWSEHVSSSGKKYYYNCKTEVSQWEKPREWIDRERDRFRSRDRDRDRDSDRCYSRSGHEKHSNTRGANSSSSKDCSSGSSGGGCGGGGGGNNGSGARESATGSRHWSSGSSRDDCDVTPKDSRRKSHPDENIQSTQDMDISPGDSTPTSEVSYNSSSHHHHNTHLHHHHQQQQSQQPQQSQQQQQQTNAGEQQIGPVLLANALPRLISHPQIHMPSTPGGRSESSPQSTPSMIQSVVPTAVTVTSNAPGPPQTTTTTLPPSLASLPRILSSSMSTTSSSAGGGGGTTPILDNDNKNLHGLSSLLRQQSTVVSGDTSAVHTSLSVDTNHSGNIVEGPPTPTHSETADCSKAVSVPVSSPGNISSLQGVSSSLQALRPQGPTITPSLVNYYRDDLVNHVRGWPAEILEKQANKLAEEAHIMGSIQCSKVSAELKSARSIVRLTEIQATLQEQRILFLRQQIKELEELKSQNSFMSDDS